MDIRPCFNAAGNVGPIFLGVALCRMEKGEGFLRKHFREVEKGIFFLKEILHERVFGGVSVIGKFQICFMRFFIDQFSLTFHDPFICHSGFSRSSHMTQERSQTKAWLMFGIISFQHWVVVNFHKYSFQRFWF